MSDVIEIRDLCFNGDRLVVEALVDAVVLTRQQSELDPPEWGPALCRGSFLFCDDDRIPATDKDMIRLIADRIDTWEVISNDG
jgi:hypothetical protein